MNEPELTPAARLMQFMSASAVARSIQVAAKLGLADLIGPQPRSVEELARDSGTHAPSLYRMLRALAGVGIFTETEDRRFALTPMGECLKSGERSLRPMILWRYSLAQVSENLLYSVQTGRSAFEKVHGVPAFDYYAAHPEEAEVFNAAMRALGTQLVRSVLPAYDFSGVRRLVDVGGGSGALTVALLEEQPALAATLVELPFAVGMARSELSARGLSARCELVAQDALEAVPGGGDLYVLSNILHEWDDAAAQKMLENCRCAMASGGKVLVVEMLIPPGNGFSPSKYQDLVELVMTGRGRERTEPEMRALLEAAGLQVARILPTSGSLQLIEATPR